MFNFLFKSDKVAPDLSFISVDMHSHLLPGLDDGLQDVAESVDFIKQLKALGYKRLICTPHILSDLYPNSRQTILPKLDIVRKAVKKEGIDIHIEAAAEYMIDHFFAEIIKSSKKNELLIVGKEFILVEMSYLAPSPNFDKVIFDLRMMGLNPILAHPERYTYLHNQFEEYYRFIELGCKLQVNLLSLSGGYGPAVKRVAEKLLKNNMVEFAGTDMHHDKHMAMLTSLSKKKEFYHLFEGIELRNRHI